MKLFQKKTKLVIYNEDQKNQMIEKLETKNIPYKLRLRQNEISADQTYFEFTIAENDLLKVG